MDIKNASEPQYTRSREAEAIGDGTPELPALPDPDAPPQPMALRRVTFTSTGGKAVRS